MHRKEQPNPFLPEISRWDLPEPSLHCVRLEINVSYSGVTFILFIIIIIIIAIFEIFLLPF